MTTAIANATKDEAAQTTAEIKSEFLGVQRSWIALGRRVKDAIDQRVPAALGMSVREWLDVTFDKSAGHMLRQVQSYRMLAEAGISEERLEHITEGNAHQLARLPEVERTNPEVVEAAATEKLKEFRERVETIREKKYGIERTTWETFARKMPAAVYQALTGAETRAALVLGLNISENAPERAANLILVWESIGQGIALMTDEALKVWLVGAEGGDL